MISILFSISLLSSFLPSHPNVQCDQTPEWVTEIEANAIHEIHPSQQGKQYLLIDKQINVETEEAYTHTIHKVLENGAEDSATEEVEFDPTYESVILNKFTIIRNGQILEPNLDIRLLQRERELEQNLYTGRMSLYFMLGDIREGDLIDLAYTIKGRNQVFGDSFSRIKGLSYSTQVEKMHYRILHDKRNPLQFKFFNSDHSFEDTDLADNIVDSSLLIHKTSIHDETSNVPYDYLPCQWVQASSFPSWQAVSEWGKRIFALDSSTDECKSIVQPWLEYDTNEMRIIAALNFVQNEISYIGMEDSIYSHHPHAPKLTLTQRYGDCKDKTLLLAALLDAMGIPSTPCLVNAWYLNAIRDWLPMPDAFNHAILHVALDAKDYWIDPVQKSRAGTLKDYSQDHYGVYLLLNGEPNSFVEKQQDWGKHHVNVESHFQLSKEINVLDVKTRMEKNAANSLRAMLASEGKDALSKSYKDFYAKLFGSAEIVKPYTVQDDRQENVISTSESYTLEHLFENADDFELVSEVEYHLPHRVELSRKAPLFLHYPKEIQETIRISSDKPQSISNYEKVLEHPSFVFTCKTGMDGNDIVIDYSYSSKMNCIYPKDFKQLREILPKIYDELSYSIPYKDTPVAENLEEDSYNLIPLFAIASLFLAIGLYIILKSRKALALSELSTDTIKKKWKRAFWIFFGFNWLISAGAIACAIVIKWPIDIPTFMITLLIQILWAFFLYRKSYQNNGTKLLGVSMAILTLGIINPFNIYFLIRSMKLFRYNRTMRLAKAPH